MRLITLLSFGLVLLLRPEISQATQADDTTITIGVKTPGPVPFISQVALSASDTIVIKSIQFSIAPKNGSVTRPLSGTYSAAYLSDRGDLQTNGTIYLPVYGLYDGYTNNVTLTYNFVDGSSKQATTTITTAPFDDPCGYKNPTVLQARTKDTSLSYDYLMVKERCDKYAPAILDTDGALRWVGTAFIADISATFYDNSVFIASGTSLYRIDLDGTVTFLHDYSDIGVTFIHHNIDRGKFGLILDVQTASYYQSTNLEVDTSGNVIKIWDMAAIISAAMTAGGDDPSQFVYPAPNDWWHNNSVVYNRADDSLIISSRENFVICLDYSTNAIKWILGDTTKKWHIFPSLAQYALTLAPGSLPPIGQHAVSFSYDQHLLLYDNGEGGFFQQPGGLTRGYSAPRKYQLNLETRVATEVWNYEVNQSIFNYICSSIYEDAPLNYLIDYSVVPAPSDGSLHPQLLGLNAAGEKVFSYQYGASEFCNTAFNSIPLHLDSTKFPAVGPQALNISTRGSISTGDNVLIAGFIITGNESKTVALRLLGPSLAQSGVGDFLADPVLSLYNSSGHLVATNDDWQSDPAAAAELTANHLAPGNAAEAALVATLAPATYTAVGSSKGGDVGIGLVEAYDLSPLSGSRLANISTRGLVGAGENVLISGFIVGDLDNASVIIRALGPSLAPAISNPLSNPRLTVYDGNGVALTSNDDWQDDPNKLDIIKDGLAPNDVLEAATLLHPPAGVYSVVVAGEDDPDGTALVEVYDLDP
ncbi:MAG: aryl-sulfate sulfotransferase [Chthoniobacterales bacterium]|nr:aryl-sulfate sulfotransferase [Chthoniobacterales bacterium]